MKLPKINKNRYAVIVAALAGIMLLDVVYQIQMHVRWRIWIPDSLAANTATTKPTDTKPTDTRRAAMRPMRPNMPQLSQSIKKRNIFTQPGPKGHGVSLTGVMGTFALFADRSGRTFSLEEGKSSNGITLKTINDYVVTIEYQGKPETMKLFNEQGQQNISPSAGGMMPSGSMRPMRMGRGGSMPEMQIPDNVPPEVRQRIMEKMSKSSLNRNQETWSQQTTSAPSN